MEDTEIHPRHRTKLEVGETARGEIAAGPNHFWRVPLDKGTLRWKNGLIELVGTETQITVSGDSIHACVQWFWQAFELLSSELRNGRTEAWWLESESQREMFSTVIQERYLETLATPPTDGEEYAVLGEFWDGVCPPEMNPRPRRLVFPPF